MIVLRHWSRLGCARVIAVLALGIAFAAPALSAVQLRWLTNDQSRIVLEATGFDTPLLEQIDRDAVSAAYWQKAMPVHVRQGSLEADIAMPTMLGRYRLVPNGIQFEPQFPLEPGVEYSATLYPSRFGARQRAPISASFRLPKAKPHPPTVVTRIQPAAAVLPENLLKFYIHFSAPMSRGEVYECVRLLELTGRKEDGGETPVELPFLELGEELWNPEQTRVTLILDPGRIKRGLRPLEESGGALTEGRRYALEVAALWRDSAGQPLQQGARKNFTVGPADRTPPEPAKWLLHLPRHASREALRVEFDEPLDAALAQRLIQVVAADGTVVPGDSSIESDERRWQFVPSGNWRDDGYELRAAAILEDLAGNNPGRPFDVELHERGEPAPVSKTVRRSFRPLATSSAR